MSATHALADDSRESWGRTLAKLCFFICCVLIAASLVLLSLSLTGARDTSNVSLGGTVRQNLGRLNQGLREELLGAASVTNHVSNAIAKVTNVHALIRPADYIATPVIPPSAKPLITSTVVALPAQPIASASVVSLPITPRTDATNSYAWSNCTWWAAARRAQFGAAIPNNWGNAATWATRATHDGYRVDHTPSPGAIMQTARAADGLGHVAIVEQIDPSGTWHISEMNVIGLNIVDHTAKPAAAAASYYFIHDKP